MGASTTFFELDSFAGTAIPLELREKLFPLTLLEFKSLLKPITTDVNSDTPVAWSSGMVELTRNFADEAVVPPPLYSLHRNPCCKPRNSV